MDLAKIRKRLKDKEGLRPSVGDPPAIESQEELSESVISPAEIFQSTSDVTESPLKAEPEEKPNAEPAGGAETLHLAAPEMTLAEEPQRDADGGAGTETEDNFVELLIFKLADEDYAFRVADVEEIIKPYGITKVPGADSFVAGITSLRGRVIPVVDLRRRLLSEKVNGLQNDKVLILKGPLGAIGALIDRGIDVIRVAEGDIVGPPAHLTEDELKYIEGIAPHENRFFSILRTKGVLEFDSKTQRDF